MPPWFCSWCCQVPLLPLSLLHLSFFFFFLILCLSVCFKHSSMVTCLTKFNWTFISSFWMFFSCDMYNISLHNIFLCFSVCYGCCLFIVSIFLLYRLEYYLRRNLTGHHATRKFHVICKRVESDVILRGYKKGCSIWTVVIQKHILCLCKYESIP